MLKSVEHSMQTLHPKWIHGSEGRFGVLAEVFPTLSHGIPPLLRWTQPTFEKEKGNEEKIIKSFNTSLVFWIPIPNFHIFCYYILTIIAVVSTTTPATIYEEPWSLDLSSLFVSDGSHTQLIEIIIHSNSNIFPLPPRSPICLAHFYLLFTHPAHP